jgi:hypothetical protein
LQNGPPNKKQRRADDEVKAPILDRLSLPSALDELSKVILEKSQIIDYLQNQYHIVLAEGVLEALTLEQLTRARIALEELDQLLSEEMRPALEKVTPLSSKFYDSLPKSLFVEPALIKTRDDIHAKYDLLFDLVQAINSAKVSNVDKDDVVFIDPNSADFKIIETYVRDTGDTNGARLLGVFALPPLKKDPESFSMDPNRKLLWLPSSPGELWCEQKY